MVNAHLLALFTALAVLNAGAASAEDAGGTWAGAIDDHMAVLVHIQKTPGGYSGLFEAHEQPVARPDPKAFNSVIETVSATPDHLAFAVPVVGGAFDAHWDAARKAWLGTFQWGPGGYVSQVALSRTTANSLLNCHRRRPGRTVRRTSPTWTSSSRPMWRTASSWAASW